MKNAQKTMNQRANALADRLILGANALINFGEGLSDSDWQTPAAGDGRTIGVIIHHVASMYPMEIELAQTLAAGQPITEATNAEVDKINARHAKEYASVNKQETIDFLRSNSKSAADAVRGFTDADLDSAASVSLNAEAPLTAQFFIEDHALRHSFHHLARLRMTLNR